MPESPFQRRRGYGWMLAAVVALATPAAFAIPSISQQPQATAGTAGTPVSLNILATGSGTLTYQWRRNGSAIAGAVSPLLSLTKPSQADCGFYDVLVSDGTGTVTSATAYLRIAPSAYPDTVMPLGGAAVLLEHGRTGGISSSPTLADGSFYVWGSFSSVAGERRARLARFKADGTLDRAYVPPGIDGDITDLAPQADGRLVVVGEFHSVNGASSVGIVRLSGDGTVDTTFQVGSGIGSSINIYPRVALASDGAIVVAGRFNTYQGQAAAGMIRILPSGALDRTFVPPRFENPPYNIAIAPNGKIYCAGVRLDAAAGVKNNGVCRLLPNGVFDSTFDAGEGTGTINGPTGIFQQKDGRVLVTGFFSSFGGRSTPAGIVRLNENGSIDPSFTVGVAGVRVDYVEQVASGDLLVSFNSAPSSVGFLSRLKLDGSLDRTFTAPAFHSSGAVRVTPTGRIVIAGGDLISDASGQSRADVALLESNGVRANTFVDVRFPAEVKMLRLLPEGKFLVAGTFSHWNGTAVAPIVRVNADLTLDSSFRATVNPGQAITDGGGTMQPDGRIVLVGAFAGTGSGAQVRRFNADGTPDTTFQTSTVLSSTAGISVLHDGRIAVPDALNQPGLRLLAADGTTITRHEFAAGGDSISSSTKVVPTANGQNFVLGGFSTWAGQPRPKVVRLNRDGSVDPTFAIDGTGIFFAVAVDTWGNPAQSTGRIVFNAYVYYNTNRLGTKLAGVLPNGQTDPTFTAALPIGAVLTGHTLQADDRILVWGMTTSNVPVPQPFAMRLLANGAVDPSFAIPAEFGSGDIATRTWTHVLTLDDGNMVVATAAGTLIRFSHVLTPIITTQPVAVTRAAGESAAFTVTAAGMGPLTYQWFRDGNAIAGATSATLTVPFVLAANAGQYSVTVSNVNGAMRSANAQLIVPSAASSGIRLSNLSVRATTAGAAPIITGFTIAGGSKATLIRGIGPGLAQFGVPGTAADPRLAVFSGSTLIEQNDNWGGVATLSAAANSVGAFPIPTGSLDAAVLLTSSGSATVQVSATGGGGVVLTEIYDTAPLAGLAARLSNVSVRSQVGTGTDILIAGFSVAGSGSKALLIRGVGPGLAAFGVPGTLADPQIALFSGGARIAENGDWGGGALLASAFESVGAFPLAANSKDAALVIALPAGSYTVQLSGTGGGTGEGLIEVYELQ